MSMIRFVAVMFAVFIVLNGGVVHAQAYPNKPIRIFTSNVGGGSDFVSRLIAQGITGPLGQPVIVENRGGPLAAENVAKAAPDGYTLLVNAGTWYIASLLRKTPYDPARDFTSITITSSSPNILVVHPSLPVKSVKEFIALAKARPGDLNYATSGVGSAGHLLAELFASMTGLKFVHVAYKGSAPGATALLSGEVQLIFSDIEPVGHHIKSGRMRALAVSSAQPSALFPGLPTIAATVPGYVARTSTGVFAPVGTPQPIINRLNQEIVRVVKTPEAKEQFFRNGSEVVGSTAEELAAWMKSDMALWAKVIKQAGIKAD